MNFNDYVSQGIEFLQKNEYEPSIENFKAAQKLNPNDASAKDSLASAYYIRGLTFTSKEEHARTIMSRGIDYDKKKDYARAISDFEKVLKFRPNDGTARELLEMAKAERAKH